MEHETTLDNSRGKVIRRYSSAVTVNRPAVQRGGGYVATKRVSTPYLIERETSLDGVKSRNSPVFTKETQLVHLNR